MDRQYFKSHTMCWGTLGTVRPFSGFHPQRDVIQIREAVQKKDAATLVRILTNRNSAQRQDIAKIYKETTQQELIAGMKRVLSGDLEALMLELMMPPLQHEAYRLHQAMAGLGTDEETLLEILCTRSSEKLRGISAAYQEMYKKDLEKEAKGETSGDFAELIVALMNKEDVSGFVQKDIESLSASLDEKKAQAAPWIDILTSRDSNHLNKVECIQNPEVYLAKRLTGMKAAVVHGIMVSHSEEDLLGIRVAFLKLTGTSLYTTLQKNFKGYHLEALLAICRSED
ncbi:annexin A2 isoform X2 [Hippocampus comes]|uniref:annexin A2 isoform X2 n=1 Tax=Hippocampus comes TaxID=109280 RepID=UPI00094EA83B|nr:PREDICTED: annexin A2-like isoform X2 [Hippocampus comes]